MKLGLFALACVVVAFAVGVARPWHEASATRDVGVTRSTLRPGKIILVVRNGSAEPVRIAQVIVNDAFADFSGPDRAVAPGRTAQVTVDYAWVKGEAYEIRLVTATGAIFDDEIDDAEVS